MPRRPPSSLRSRGMAESESPRLEGMTVLFDDKVGLFPVEVTKKPPKQRPRKPGYGIQ